MIKRGNDEIGKSLVACTNITFFFSFLCKAALDIFLIHRSLSDATVSGGHVGLEIAWLFLNDAYCCPLKENSSDLGNGGVR
jgi:hypothetical protein